MDKEEHPKLDRKDDEQIRKCTPYQLQMLEDPWAHLTVKNMQYDNRKNIIIHSKVVEFDE